MRLKKLNMAAGAIEIPQFAAIMYFFNSRDKYYKLTLPETWGNQKKKT